MARPGAGILVELGFLVATALTWLMHSSLTMVLFVMALASAHALPMPLAFALVLGANVGGAIAPLSALFNAPPAGKRVIALTPIGTGEHTHRH